MTEKYCVHSFSYVQGKLRILKPIKTKSLIGVAVEFEFAANEDGPSSVVSVPLRFRKVAYSAAYGDMSVWMGSAKLDRDVWAKAHLTSFACPDGWKSEVAV